MHRMWVSGVNPMFSFQNFSLTIVILLIVMAWMSFLSVVLA